MKTAIALLCLIAAPAYAAGSLADFHQSLYALHEQQISGRKIRTEEEKASYEGAAAAGYRYVETSYYDADPGVLLSRIRRDAARPEYVHIAEVYLYENGRLVRDFGSITLPWSPLQPVRTFINFHHYNGALHSVRQYDYSGEVSYESCKGDLNGKPIRLSLDSLDIDKATKATSEYQACFNGMNTDWAQYTQPH